MENFKRLAFPMKQLVDSCIDNSVDFCSDMRYDTMSDEEIDAMTIVEIRAQVSDNAQQFFCQELDPDGAVECPPFIAVCIAERVKTLSAGKVMGYRSHQVR